MKKFVFVILHYFTIEETKKCVDSIMKFCSNSDIVIVDNASPNGTGEELKELYSSLENIHVILNKENSGFARGNNIGFKYAKENLNPDYIVMCNNDTYLLDNDFQSNVESEYENSKFAVLGPKILLPEEKINPVNLKITDYKILRKQLFYFEIKYFLNLIFIDELFVKIKEKTKMNIEFKKVVDDNVNKRFENIVLNGCFFIFSKEYINKFDGLDERTNFYFEEELLFIRLKKNNMKSVYNPNISIFHNESVSTKVTLNKKRKKNLFRYKNGIISLRIVLKELKLNKDILDEG